MTDDGPILKLEHDGPLRIITMNNPTMYNAMVDELHIALTDVWAGLQRDNEARAVILTGAGKAFSSGGSMPEFERNTVDLNYRRTNMRIARSLVDNLLACHLPVIAAVNGPAVGLGSSLATACDLVLIAEDAYLADPHVSVGLVAGDGGAATWPFMMSILKAKEYIFTGERISAQKAVELGLANRVVPKADLLDEAKALGMKLAALPAQPLQETKRALNIHLQKAVLAVMPFALTAEAESFNEQDVLRKVEEFKARSAAKAAPGS